MQYKGVLPQYAYTYELNLSRFKGFANLPRQWVLKWPTIHPYSPHKIFFQNPQKFVSFFGWTKQVPFAQPHSHSFRIQKAIVSNDLKELHKCIKQGADLNAELSPQLKHTPLSLAVAFSRGSILQLLLFNGADPNLSAQGGHLPLSVCVLQGRLQMMNILLNGGASINQKEQSGHSPFDTVFRILKEHRVAPPQITIQLKIEKALEDKVEGLGSVMVNEAVRGVGREGGGEYGVWLCWFRE